MVAAHLTADEAARRLGVSKQTLYAYVSRGLVTSEPGPGPSRARLYPADAVERLRAQRATSAPERAATSAMRWGPPVLESSLTLIDQGRLWYRGRDALELARTSSLEDVAALLWDAPDPIHAPSAPGDGALRPDPVGALIARFADRPTASFAGARTAHDRNVVHAAGLLADAFAAVGAPGDGPLANRLARAAGATDAAAISSALVLCADHELNISAFTARCVASAEATLDGAVLGALCAFTGARHGAAGHRVERLLADAAYDGPSRAVSRAIAEFGEVPGFGHPLYPDGDPRAAELLAHAPPDDPLIAELVRLCADEVGTRPNLDFGLVAFAHAQRLRPGAAQAIFALGRLVGWIAHIFETWGSGAFIRPRARYVGPAPRRGLGE